VRLLARRRAAQVALIAKFRKRKRFGIARTIGNYDDCVRVRTTGVRAIRLENRQPFTGLVSSNLTLSAKFRVRMTEVGPSRRSPTSAPLHSIQLMSFASTSERFFSAANLVQCELTRNGSPIALCRNATTWESRSSIAFSIQDAARSISPQQVWKNAKPFAAPWVSPEPNVLSTSIPGLAGPCEPIVPRTPQRTVRTRAPGKMLFRQKEALRQASGARCRGPQENCGCKRNWDLDPCSDGGVPPPPYTVPPR
jgi:hypothetical protein